MTRRKTRNTRISLDDVRKLEGLKKSTGMTSADILDEALKNYSEADTSSIKQPSNDEKLRKKYRAEFIKDLQDNPRYIRLDVTKPPKAIIDAAIVSLWRDNPVREWGRKDVLEHVVKQMQTSTWAEYHKTWFDSHKKYKGKFELTVNNRINALIRNQVLEPVKGSRGMYKLFRILLQDEWDIIDGIQKLEPQRGIVIPNFWKRTRLVA